MKRLFIKALILTAAAFFASNGVFARDIVKKSIAEESPDANELVIVGNDTVPLVIKERNFGRYDRGLFNYLYIPKGKWSFGLTASYGELSTDDVQVLSVISDVDFKGKAYSLKPFISYFFRNNSSIGLRFNYSRGEADLGKLAMDFSDDLNFSIRDVSYYTQSYTTSLFYRNYIGFNRSKIFGLFNEVELAFGSGSSRFKRIYNDQPRDTRTVSTKASLNFSPGVCVFLQDFLAFNVSFGVFGLHLTNEKQTTYGIDEEGNQIIEDGHRFTSGANFRFNIFNINFGLMVVI